MSTRCVHGNYGCWTCQDYWQFFLSVSTQGASEIGSLMIEVVFLSYVIFWYRKWNQKIKITIHKKQWYFHSVFSYFTAREFRPFCLLFYNIYISKFLFPISLLCPKMFHYYSFCCGVFVLIDAVCYTMFETNLHIQLHDILVFTFFNISFIYFSLPSISFFLATKLSILYCR